MQSVPATASMQVFFTSSFAVPTLKPAWMQAIWREAFQPLGRGARKRFAIMIIANVSIVSTPRTGMGNR